LVITALKKNNFIINTSKIIIKGIKNNILIDPKVKRLINILKKYNIILDINNNNVLKKITKPVKEKVTDSKTKILMANFKKRNYNNTKVTSNILNKISVISESSLKANDTILAKTINKKWQSNKQITKKLKTNKKNVRHFSSSNTKFEIKKKIFIHILLILLAKEPQFLDQIDLIF